MEHSQQESQQSVPEQTGDAARPRNAGRKKIKIAHITDNRGRQVTFLKRKNGLLKKAHELSILCGCGIAVVIFNNDNGKLYEYFNPSAEQTFKRYAGYTGVSERRRSDVIELEDAKGSCDIPNEEPELAEAALRAANMSAVRHAHPENYVYPPPGRPQIHPNVTVPEIQMPPPPAPVHRTVGASSSRRSVAGPSNRPVLVHTPTAEYAPPVSHAPTSALIARDADNRNHSLTAPQVTIPFPVHLEEQDISQRTAENQISANSGHPPPASNEQPHQRENSRRQALDAELETRNQQNYLGSLYTPPNPVCDEIAPQLVRRGDGIGEDDVFIEGQAAILNPVPLADLTSARLPRFETPTFTARMESAWFASSDSGLPSQHATVSPLSGHPTASSTPHTPAEQTWNTPFFEQPTQETEELEIRTALPPLNPLLGYLPNSESQFNALHTGNLIGHTELDALPFPSDADINPLRMVEPVSSSPLPSTGIIRNRDREESLDEDRVRKRQRLD